MLRFIKGSIKTIATIFVVAFLVILLVPASAQADETVPSPPTPSVCPEGYLKGSTVCIQQKDPSMLDDEPNPHFNPDPHDPSLDPYVQGNAPTGGGPNAPQTWYVTYVQHESPYLEVLATLVVLMKVLFGALIGLAAGFLICDLIFDRRPSQF